VPLGWSAGVPEARKEATAMMTSARPGALMAALALVAATALAACGSSTPTALRTGAGGAFGKIPAAATGPEHAGTITLAEAPGTAPTWILPIVTSAADTVTTVGSFEYQLWRPLYWFDNGVEPTFNTALSLADRPVWSNGDKTVSVTLKSSYKWSDGQPITARDVVFFVDEVKAAIKEDAANWAPFSPNLGIPDEVSSMTAPSASTVVFHLTKAVNPTWFWDDELVNVVPMPAQSWAKASASGPLLNFAVPANATKIYNYLAAQSKAETTYPSNPLWKTVDGPYTVTAFNDSTGAYTLTPSRAYDGPHAAKISTVDVVPYTSDTAEFDAVRAGSIDVGYLPLTDIKQVKIVESGGYNVFGYPDFGFSYIAYNFADTTGDFNHVIAQLYVRQAIAHLEDEQGYIKAFFGGAGGAVYGPVPAIPKSPFTPADATTDPYPFSVSAAISLLKRHGWTINTSGTDVCAKAGTGAGDCGAGIPAGTKLAFNLIYASAPSVIGEMCTDLASEAARAGITIHLSSSNFNYIVTYYDDPVSSGKPYIDKWAMEDYGGFTDYTYPTQFGVFNGPGAENGGFYNNAEANKLITDSISSSNPDAVKNEASFETENQPGLFQPNFDLIYVWKKDISGPPDSFANLTEYYLTPEFWYFTK
jgi:peptide/nickel transport system substrate-binding protein